MAKSKRCTQCGKDLPLSEFSRNARNPDGLKRYCKPCNRAQYREWAARPSSKPKIRARGRRYAARNPAKIKARRRVRTLVEKGEMPEPSKLRCVRCGEPASEYHHSYGYQGEKARKVQPVCKICHSAIHAERGDFRKSRRGEISE